MATPGNTKVKLLHSLMSILFLALFAFPLLPFKVTNVLFMAFAAFTLTSYFVKPFPVGKTLIRNLVFIIPFMPYLAELCISGFDPVARFEFEKKILFFTAPLIIPLYMEVTGFRNYKLTLLIFAFSVSALALYSFAALLMKGIPFLNTGYENGAFIFRDNFENISGLHPTYFSIFALASACFLYYASLSYKKILKITCLVLSLLLFVAVLFLAVRIAIITAIIFLLVWVGRSRYSLPAKLMTASCAIVLLFALSLTLPSLKNRFSEISSWDQNTSLHGNTMSERVGILDCSLKVFSDNFWFGTGSRHFQQILNDRYVAEGQPLLKDRNFNPHNQFLSEGINYGVFALIAFIICLFIIFRKVIKTPEGMFFGVAITLFFLSESLLERQMGVYFFGLIAIILFNLYETKDEKYSLKGII